MPILERAQPSLSLSESSFPEAKRSRDIRFTAQNLYGENKVISVPKSLFRESLSKSEERLAANKARGVTGPAALVSKDDKILKAIAETITVGSGSELESAKAIHSWVKQNVSLSAAGNRSRRGYPIEALFLKSGSTADQVILTVSMCKALGIEAAMALHDSHLLPIMRNSSSDTGMLFRGKHFIFIDSEIPQSPYQSKVCGPWIDGLVTIRQPDGNPAFFNVPAMEITNRRIYDGERRISRVSAPKVSAILERDMKFIKPIAETLCENCLTTEEKASRLLSFVQNRVVYTPDENNRDSFQFPVETLVSGRGDCEDSALLYACMCRAVGIDFVLLSPKGHLAIGVHGNFKGESRTYRGKDYYYAETTAGGYPIGVLPKQWDTAIQLVKI